MYLCVEGKSGDKKANGVDSSDEPEVKRQRIAVDGLEDDDDQQTPTPLFMDEPLRGPPLAPVAHAPIDDSHMRLKYTYGINAWKQWVTAKNAELEAAAGTGRSGASRPKLFKSEILQCSADELNVALSLFVREVRKPTGQAYAADSVYYLCLGMPAHCIIIISSGITNCVCTGGTTQFMCRHPLREYETSFTFTRGIQS